MITNDKIIKAAKAAGLHCYICGSHVRYVLGGEKDRTFLPLTDDGDNAMIRRGAEIDVQFWSEEQWRSASVEATAWIKRADGDLQDVTVEIEGNGKAQAEREAVILCAAQKCDAMQGEMK